MATGGVPNDEQDDWREQGEWFIYMRDDYSGPIVGVPGRGGRLTDGVGDGAFRLWIEGGQQVNIRHTNDVYVEMRDGKTYAVWVANRKGRAGEGVTVEVDLHIDGRFLGSFLLDGKGALRIERPKDVAKKFTFFKPRGSGSDRNRELGTIRCLFKPRCCKIEFRDLVTGSTRMIFVRETYTVLDLKKHIDRVAHKAPDQQNLWLVDGIIALRLEDEKLLSRYDIEENSVIECYPPSYQGINVSLPNKRVVLFMHFSDTVLDFKKRIHKVEPDLPPEKQHLFIYEKHTIELDDFQLLSHYMENEERRDDRVLLLCNPPHPKRILIYVRRLVRKTIVIEPCNYFTIMHLKDLVNDKEGIPQDQQRLIFAGIQLENDKMLYEYNITHKCVVHMVLKLRGGGDTVTMCGPDVHWTRGSTRLTGVSDQTFPKRVDDDAEYDASAGEELMIKLVGKDTYCHSEPLKKRLKIEESQNGCVLC